MPHHHRTTLKTFHGLQFQDCAAHRHKEEQMFSCQPVKDSPSKCSLVHPASSKETLLPPKSTKLNLKWTVQDYHHHNLHDDTQSQQIAWPQSLPELLPQIIITPRTPRQYDRLMNLCARHIQKNIYSTAQCGAKEDMVTFRIKFSLFDELLFPLDSNSFGQIEKYPTIETIADFLKKLLRISTVDSPIIIIALILLQRLLDSQPDFKLYPFNWKRAVLGCTILACKIYEERGVWNSDFITPQEFPLANLGSLSRLEALLLRILDFQTSISELEYKQHFFAITSPSTSEEHSGDIFTEQQQQQQFVFLLQQKLPVHQSDDQDDDDQMIEG